MMSQAKQRRARTHEGEESSEEGTGRQDGDNEGLVVDVEVVTLRAVGSSGGNASRLLSERSEGLQPVRHSDDWGERKREDEVRRSAWVVDHRQGGARDRAGVERADSLPPMDPVSNPNRIYMARERGEGRKDDAREGRGGGRGARVDRGGWRGRGGGDQVSSAESVNTAPNPDDKNEIKDSLLRKQQRQR